MGRRASVDLFSTLTDLVIVFDLVETANDLTYVRTGLSAQDAPEVFRSGRALPDLGTATSGETALEPAYLVLRRGADLRIRRVPQRTGGALFAVDQLLNPDTIIVRPGGVYNGVAVIAGQIGTASNTAGAIALYRLFFNAMKSTFKRVKSYWVGPAAMILWQRGLRCTSSAKAPRHFDLSL